MSGSGEPNMVPGSSVNRPKGRFNWLGHFECITEASLPFMEEQDREEDLDLNDIKMWIIFQECWN